MSAKSIRDMDAGELQRLIGSRDEPIKLRNAAAKRFKEIRRAAGRNIQRRLHENFGKQSNLGDL